jgi:hypothetical protein
LIALSKRLSDHQTCGRTAVRRWTDFDILPYDCIIILTLHRAKQWQLYVCPAPGYSVTITCPSRFIQKHICNYSNYVEINRSNYIRFFIVCSSNIWRRMRLIKLNLIILIHLCSFAHEYSNSSGTGYCCDMM